MSKVDAMESEVLLTSSKKSPSHSSYVRKDPSHGLGYFFYRARENKQGVTIYYWYLSTYINGKRDKEYLGSNTNPNCPPKYSTEYFTIKESRAYKPKHSRR